jgi:DNA-binding NtrC family response regulator
MLERTLVRAGHQVQAISSGRQALAALRAAPVDLLITDIIMPDQEGLETITEARRIQPGLHVMAMSGGGFGKAQDYLKAARLLGAVQTLQKPFSSQDLLTAVSVALGTGADDPPPPSP